MQEVRVKRTLRLKPKNQIKLPKRKRTDQIIKQRLEVKNKRAPASQ